MGLLPVTFRILTTGKCGIISCQNSMMLVKCVHETHNTNDTYAS